jgi:three-Cys-motif partner protein
MAGQGSGRLSSDKGYAALQQMVAGIKRPKRHRIETRKGDFNQVVHEILRECSITESTASFCLLDQRTFECEWNTVRTLATFKADTNKIELFYFLASGWLDRSFAGTTKNYDQLDRWWGSKDWKHLRGMKGQTRAEFVAQRFKDELGYAHAYAWPIYERGSGGRIMYHMIHATDHPEAPKLMNRAYFNATKSRESIDKLQMELNAMWPKSTKPR